MGKTLSNVYLSTICFELYSLMQTGFNLRDGLSVMSNEEFDSDIKSVLSILESSLATGITFKESLEIANCFPRYMIDMINAGETTGNLNSVLKLLAEHYDRQVSLKNTIRSSITLPCLLVGMIVIIVLVLLIYILPIFEDMFIRLGVEMTGSARILLKIGSWFSNASLIFTILFLLIGISIFILNKNRKLLSILLNLFSEKFGNLGVRSRIAKAQFMSILSLSLGSGLPIDRSLELGLSLLSVPISERIKYAICINSISNGASLSSSLYIANIITLKECKILSLGINSGQLDVALEEISIKKTKEVQDEINTIVGYIEPSLVIFGSCVVSLILFSVILPLMSIMISL